MKDITLTAGNPASAIRSNYNRLMAITDVVTLKQEALTLVAQGGISPKNANKFRGVLAKETKLPRVQQYLTNFVLAAGGDAVIA